MAELTVIYSEFGSIKDRTPRETTGAWSDLAAKLCSFHTPSQSDGEDIESVKAKVPLWSPVQYHDGATRGNAGVAKVFALVLDFDDGFAWEDIADEWRERGYEFLIHTTIKHSADAPRWRAVFPLAFPVEAADWKRVWFKLTWHLGHGVAKMDEACKDASRIYYWPSHAPGRAHYSEHVPGNPLLPSAFTEPPKEVIPDYTPAAPPVPKDPADGLKPGEHFERDGSFDELLLAHGWKRSRSHNIYQYYTRPGKESGISAAVFQGRIGERFICHSSSCYPIPVEKALTKFRLYSLLNHNGDDSAAAKALAAQGYGIKGTNPPKEREKKEKKSEMESPAIATADASGLSNGQSLTTVANAIRLLKKHGKDLRYCRGLKAWLIWNGRYWEIDENDGSYVKRLARDMAREFGRTAWERSHETDPTKASRWAAESLQHANINATVKDCQWQEGVEVSASELDTHIDLLVVGNGTLNLRTGELLPSQREHLLTRGIEVDYDPSAECPRWLEFLAQVLPDRELMRYIWTALGYSLTGHVSEQIFFFLYGTGKNGKSTFVTTIMNLLGPYAARTQAETLMLSKNGRRPGEASGDLAELRGKRFIASSEIQSGASLDEAMIKGFTGSEIIRCRQLYKEGIEYMPEGKLWMAGNYQPKIRGVDEGIWRRPKLIPFTVFITPDKVDRHLSEKLAAELPGILAWMVKGAKQWYQFGLPACEIIDQATEAYRVEQDPLSNFLESCIVKSAETRHSTVRTNAVYERYNSWAAEEGIDKTMQPRTFGMAMKDRGYASRKSMGVMHYDGIELIGEHTDIPRHYSQGSLE